MNKKRYIFGIIGCSALIASLLISCSDEFFDTTTDDRISPDKYYNSKTDADLAIMGSYALLDKIAENLVLIDGLQSDQLNVTSNADADMIALNRHEVAGSNIYLDPSNFYKIVLDVNEVLPNLQNIIGKDRDFDSIAYRGSMGSLITLRSWTYYTFFKVYGKVTLMPVDAQNIDITKAPTYITDKNVLIDTLLAELVPFYDTLDINRYPIDLYALIGELYLDKGEYAKAAEYLKYSVDGPHYGQMANADRNHYMMITNKSQKDIWKNIFVEPMSQNNALTRIVNGEGLNLAVRTATLYSIAAEKKNNIEQWMHPDFNYMVKPNSALVDSFYNQIQDITTFTKGDKYRGIKITFDTTATGEAFVNKYSLPTVYRNSADIILYRDADIHLMLAEALNRSGRSDVAIALMNKGIKNMTPKPADFPKWTSNNIGVRGRVTLKPRIVPDSILNGTNQDSLVTYVEDMIMLERNMELAFEGKRWFDLVRVAEHRGKPEYLADKVALKFGPVGSPEYNEMYNKLLNKDKWYLPLP